MRRAAGLFPLGIHKEDHMGTTARTWALVTGASGGMGADFARQLAARGYDLFVTARRERELGELKEEIRSARPGTEVRVLAGDLGEKATRTALLEATGALPVEVLVNNAGFGSFGAFDSISEERDEGMIALNVSALNALTRAFAARMRAAGRGRILLTSSIGAFQPCPLYAVYGATKAYVLSYGLAARSELAGSGVSLTVLCPGVTRTGFFDAASQEKLSRFQSSSIQESATVVRGALAALFRGKAVYVPGMMNRLNAFATRFVSRTFAAKIAGSLLGARS
jgi:uncharacterized protein